MSIAITGLGPDFTRMESFGKVEAFAETLVSSLSTCNSNKHFPYKCRHDIYL